jgi:hypothetical protein
LIIDTLVHRTEEAAVNFENIKVYPNGFTVNVAILFNPHTAQDRVGMLHMRGGLHRMPRLGIRFSDGRSAGQSVTNMMAMGKDEQGLPTGIVLRQTGSSGGSNGWHFGVWVYPLPPDGPVEVFIGLPAAGLDEASVTVDGAAIREAASRAKVLWE